MRKLWRNLPIASETSVLAAAKTGQVLVRTFRDPSRAESSVISGNEVGYVRRSEISSVRSQNCWRYTGHDLLLHGALGRLNAEMAATTPSGSTIVNARPRGDQAGIERWRRSPVVRSARGQMAERPRSLSTFMPRPMDPQFLDRVIAIMRDFARLHDGNVLP